MINNFLSSFTKDVAKPSRLRVLFDTVIGDLSDIMSNESLSFRCESASLPGRNIATGDMRIYGPTEKFPYQSTYDDITMTFICTDSMNEKLYFNQWMEYINPLNSWNFKYKSEYVSNIMIQQYDNMGGIVHTIKLVDAFPVSVADMGLDWSNGDGYHKLSVTFAYTYWTKEISENGSQADASTYNESLGGQSLANIPSLLVSNPDAQLRGTYLDVTNQSIGPFDTIKDQEASRINKKNQTNNIVPSHLRS